MRTDLERRLRALERGPDDVHVILRAPGDGPALVLVDGRTAPTGFRLPAACAFEITNPRPPLGCA